MRRLILTALLLTAACPGARSQRLDPEQYVYPVLGVARLYSANFGEIRPGHFHAGVDIKTDGAEGKPLVAVADGYVSRVVLQAGGYGRAIYLTLHNGQTAVYGHLQRFRDDIECHVREERIRRRANNVDLHFGPTVWPVRQGDRIGLSGNSGSSMGPHLHFEIRDTKSQRLRNVVREGVIRPKDDLPPRILRVHWVEIDSVQGVPLHGEPEGYAVVRDASGRYRMAREEPVPVGRKGYFVVEVTDRRNEVQNTFGVWRVTAWADDEPYFEYRMDGFTFDLSRYCDAVSHYPLKLASRNEVLRLAQLERAPRCFYPLMRDRGLLRTAEGEVRKIRIEAEDDCGNCSELEFRIMGRPDPTPVPALDPEATVVRPDWKTRLRVGERMHAAIPEGAVFEPCAVDPQPCETPPAPQGVAVLSSSYRIFGKEVPLRLPVAVSIRCDVPRRLQMHAQIAVRSAAGKLVAAGGSYADGAVQTTTRQTDGLTVVADTLPPTIVAQFARDADLTQSEALRFKATDNFSGIGSWTLLIDGEWVPCDRFPMKGTLVHRFEEPARGRRHEVRLTVRDGAGNTARFEGTFVR